MDCLLCNEPFGEDPITREQQMERDKTKPKPKKSELVF